MACARCHRRQVDNCGLVDRQVYMTIMSWHVWQVTGREQISDKLGGHGVSLVSLLVNLLIFGQISKLFLPWIVLWQQQKFHQTISPVVMSPCRMSRHLPTFGIVVVSRVNRVAIFRLTVQPSSHLHFKAKWILHPLSSCHRDMWNFIVKGQADMFSTTFRTVF